MGSLSFGLGADTISDLETAVDAALAPLLSDIITGVAFIANDQPRNSQKYQLAVTYTTGAAAISTPFAIKIFSGRTAAEATANANVYLAANPSYFFSGLFVQPLTNASSAVRFFALAVYNTSLVDGASHYAGSGSGGGGGNAGAFASYTFGTLPNYATIPACTPVYITDAVGGAVPAYSDPVLGWLAFSDNQPVVPAPDFNGQLMSKAIPVYTTPPSSVWNFYAAEGFPNITYQIFTPDAGHDGAGGYGPGTAQIPAFQTVILAAQAAGCKVLGYIATDYRTRPLASVFQAIDDFYAFYPTIDGLFFDTVADNQFDYYYQIRQYYLSRPRNIMVLNPGTTTVESYMLLLTGEFDAMLNFESDYATYLTFTPPAYQINYDMRKFWHLVHDVPGSAEANIALKLAQQNWVGNIFVTDGVEPYPWTPLSAFESEMTAYVEATSAAFSYINIPGRIGEWSAQNVTKDGSDLVSAVFDQAAIAHDMTAAGALRPLWVDNVLNGKPVLRFSGSQYVVTGAWAYNQPVTIAVVYKATVSDVIACGGAAVGVYDSSSNDCMTYTAGLFPPGSINKHGQFAVGVAVFDAGGGTSQIRVNGVQSTAASPGNFGWTSFAIGAYANGNNKFSGDVAKVLVYRGSLGPTAIAELESLLAAEFGITFP